MRPSPDPFEQPSRAAQATRLELARLLDSVPEESLKIASRVMRALVSGPKRQGENGFEGEAGGAATAALGLRTLKRDHGESLLMLDHPYTCMNPQGALHGGMAFVLADTAMGAALSSYLHEGDRMATLQASMHYLSPGTGKPLTCRAKVRRAGRRTAVVEFEVTEEGGEVIATGSGSFYIRRASGGEVTRGG